jgi:hypothetical protein
LSCLFAPYNLNEPSFVTYRHKKGNDDDDDGDDEDDDDDDDDDAVIKFPVLT